MKSLRILTGAHAGVQLPLEAPTVRLGNDVSVDIQLDDWTQTAIELRVQPDGDVLLRAAGGAETAVRDFAPLRFGDIVLCVGPATGEWPSDMALIGKVLEPAAPAGVPRQVWRRAAIAGFATGALMLGGLVMIAGHGADEVRAEDANLKLSARVGRALAAGGAAELTVSESQGRVIVEGLLASGSELAKVRSLLEPFGREVITRLASAPDVAGSIGDALGGAQLHVRYAGKRVFVVEGSTADLERLIDDARRVGADFGSLVARIEIDVAEKAAPSRGNVGAVLSDDDVQYVQTSDGTKHVTLPRQQESDAGPPAQTSLPPN